MSGQNKVGICPSTVVSNNKEKVQTKEKITIGSQVKAIRTSNKLTLEETSKLTGLARSTLSKIENQQLSPTFTVLKKLALGFNIELPQLFTKPKVLETTARRDLTLHDTGMRHVTPTYEHEVLATQFSNKKMMPSKSRVCARCFNDFEEWIRHEGEEFLLVLEGEVQFITEFYEAVTLTKGDSVYYDAIMGHLVISLSEEDALILWVNRK
jgi:transcriptional regulator with XRE-family HTH domain